MVENQGEPWYCYLTNFTTPDTNFANPFPDEKTQT
jgi:hypothetical protein